MGNKCKNSASFSLPVLKTYPINKIKNQQTKIENCKIVTGFGDFLKKVKAKIKELPTKKVKAGQNF